MKINIYDKILVDNYVYLNRETEWCPEEEDWKGEKTYKMDTFSY